jgi:hypothetical protein
MRADLLAHILAGQPVTFAFGCALSFGFGFFGLVFGIPS